MCEPVTAMWIGAAVGGTIGYSKGGAKGALLGAGFGALGGYAGAGGFAAGGAGNVGNVILGTTGSGNVLTPAGFTSLYGTSAAGAGGGGFLSSIFSPQVSLGAQVIGFGVNMMGQQQQLAFQEARIAHQQAQLRNQMLASEQDIASRNAALEVNLDILGKQGAVGRGAIRAEQAGRGVLVDRDSAADRTAQLAGDVAFQKNIRRHEVALKNRQDRIIASGLQSDSALLDFQRADAQRASVFGGISGGLKLAGSLSSKFRFNDGNLAFRT